MIKRFWIPFGLAILIVCLIEAGVCAVRKPDFWDKTTWLLHDPYHSEPFDRMIVYEKLKQLIDVKPDIISVGDSSGFFSIQPNIVNRYLHGLKYVSLSTGANQAFDGYKAMALYMLERQPSVKYVVLNMYPNLVPSPRALHVADLAPIEYDDLAGIKSIITPPSAGLSPYAKSLFFYHARFDRNALLSSHKVYLEFHYTIAQTLGWTPEHDIPFDRVLQTTPFFPDTESNAGNFFGAFEHSVLLTTLNDFADMCRKHNVKLMIMFNPMAWQTIVTNDNLFIKEKLLEEFQQQNPDVIFLIDHLITPWDPAKFGMFNHISRAYVHEGSARMGMAIEKAIYDRQSLPPFKAQWKARKFPVPADIKTVGKATDEQKEAAFAYYLYTATLDKKYWGLLSARVRNLLTKDQPFNWMIEDMHARTDYLAKQGMALGYDTSKMGAEVVTLKNGYYCGTSHDVQWIHLSGVMQFGFTSAVQQVSEPVQWPPTSNIMIPIIREEKGYRFDGYCPASLLPPEPAS